MKHCKPKCHLILLHRRHTAPTVRHVWVKSMRGRCFTVPVISETVCFAVLRVEWNHSQTLLLLLEGEVKCSSLDSRGLTSWSYVSESVTFTHIFCMLSKQRSVFRVQINRKTVQYVFCEKQQLSLSLYCIMKKKNHCSLHLIKQEGSWYKKVLQCQKGEQYKAGEMLLK